MPISDNARGAVFMSGSMAGFAVNDSIMKLTFETMPLAQGVAIRGFVATVVLLLCAWQVGALAFRPSKRELAAMVVRSLGEVGGTVAYMIAIANLSLASAGAVLQAAPLAVTLAAALFLGEPVGWRRWSAIGVGFFGMLVMLRPGSEAFDPMLLLPCVTVCFIVLRDIVTRRLSTKVPALFASSITSAMMTVVAAMLIPFEGWVTPSAPIVGCYAGAAIFLIIGYVLSVTSMRVGDVSAVSPFRYTVLIYAVILGYLVFGDVPDATTFIGAGIVISAGLYTLWRETKVSTMRPAAHSPTRPFSED